MHILKISTAAVYTGALIAAPAATTFAAPSDSVPGTNCTVAQVERAVAAVAPEVIPVVSQLPGGRATAEQILTAPPAERNARIYEIGRLNPQMASYYYAHQGEINGKIRTVANTCANY